MEKLKPNSYKSKQLDSKESQKEEKHVERVISSEVRTKKKSGLRKLADVFIGSDGLNDIKENLSSDIRKTISNTLTDTIQTLLVGGPQGRGANTTYRGERVSYRGAYNSNNRSENHAIRTSYSYDDIIFETRGEAERVLESMDDILRTYHAVSVADMYDLVGITGSYTDNKYGWTDLSAAQPARVTGGGYSLKLPPAMPLN